MTSAAFLAAAVALAVLQCYVMAGWCVVGAFCAIGSGATGDDE